MFTPTIFSRRRVALQPSDAPLGARLAAEKTNDMIISRYIRTVWYIIHITVYYYYYTYIHTHTYVGPAGRGSGDGGARRADRVRHTVPIY